MAGDELSSFTENTEATVGDPWGELMDRVGAESAGAEKAPLDERSPREGGPGRAVQGHARPRSALRVRLVAPLALSALAVALAWVVLPALIEGDSPTRSDPAPGARPAQARQADEAALSPPRRVSRQRAKHRRAGWEHPAPGVGAKRRRLKEEPPLAPTSVEPSTQSEAPSPSAPAAPPPASSEPAPPHAGQKNGQAGFADGSRSSAEFGL